VRMRRAEKEASEPRVALNKEKAQKTAELCKAQTLTEFFGVLEMLDEDRTRAGFDVPLLDLRASEIELALRSFLLHIERKYFTAPGSFKEDDLNKDVLSAVHGLGIPNIPHVRELLLRLLGDEVAKLRAEGFAAELDPDTVDRLNAAASVEGFREILYERFSEVHSETILRLLHADLSEAMSEVQQRGDRARLRITQGRPPSPPELQILTDSRSAVESETEKCLLKNDVDGRSLPPAIDRAHLAHILVDEIYGRE